VKVVFVGTTKFGKRCLESLSNLKCCELVGVVTSEPEFKISYNNDLVKNVLFSDVSDFCENKSIPKITVTDGVKPSHRNSIAKWDPDVIVVVGWYYMVPSSWLEIAPAFGLHASLLPAYSGGAPLVWAMINGERSTGITLFQMASGVDDGPIAGRRETEIGLGDTIKSLYERIEILGEDLLLEFLSKYSSGELALAPQDESQRTTYPQRSPADGSIDWNWAGNRIYDFIRAQTRPYPGAFWGLKFGDVRIWNSRISEAVAMQSDDKVVFTENKLCVRCGDGIYLDIFDLELAGEALSKKEFYHLYIDAETK
jgi:methionyl-tRNA formyltransferase